ncbi:MAG: hypothetical protein RIS29_1733 [Bacteroidota bacterium]|jgi:hypothetical protein
MCYIELTTNRITTTQNLFYEPNPEPSAKVSNKCFFERKFRNPDSYRDCGICVLFLLLASPRGEGGHTEAQSPYFKVKDLAMVIS